MSIYNYKECAAYYDRLILQTKCKVEDDCSVCLETLLEKNVTYLPCKHYFHSNCLNQMIEAKTYTCPLCRYDLFNSLLNKGHRFFYNLNDTTWDDLFFNIITEYTSEAAMARANEVARANAGAVEAGASAGAVEAVEAGEAGEAGAGAGVANAVEAGAGAGAVEAGASANEAGAASIMHAYLIYYTS